MKAWAQASSAMPVGHGASVVALSSAALPRARAASFSVSTSCIDTRPATGYRNWGSRSGGKALAGLLVSPSRSRTVLLNSARVMGRSGMGPGALGSPGLPGRTRVPPPLFGLPGVPLFGEPAPGSDPDGLPSLMLPVQPAPSVSAAASTPVTAEGQANDLAPVLMMAVLPSTVSDQAVGTSQRGATHPPRVARERAVGFEGLTAACDRDLHVRSRNFSGRGRRVQRGDTDKFVA